MYVGMAYTKTLKIVSRKCWCNLSQYTCTYVYVDRARPLT